MTNVRATSWYLPDTTLHPLNGSFVVEIDGIREMLKHDPPWLSPDEADALADSLKAAAALAREYRETEDDS